MNDENKDKSEAPTQKRLDDAKKKGQVAKSKEVVSAALIIGMFLYIILSANWYIETIATMIVSTIASINQPLNTAITNGSVTAFDTFATLTLPVLLIVVPIAILSNLLQTGPVFSLHPLKWEYQKIDPIKNIKNIFTKKSLMEIVKSVIKLIILGIVIFMTVKSAIADLVQIPSCGQDCITPVILSLLTTISLYTAVAFALVGVLDFFFQRHEFQKSMRMNMDEIRKEYKEQEGDPEIKGKRKELHQEIINEEPKRAVEDSTVLVTNPEHVAIGLFYKDEVTPLPMISFKAEGREAQMMKRYALSINKPVMENVPLAHALLAKSKVKEYIPRDFIEPIAEVIRWALEQAEELAATEDD